MKVQLVLPLNVSPLIKLTRWIFLISGISYGVVKHKKYSIEHAHFKVEEEKMKVIRAMEFAREESLRNQETARDLAEALTGLRILFGGPVNSEDNDSTPTEEPTSIDDKNISLDDNSTSENNDSTPTNETTSIDDDNISLEDSDKDVK